MWLTRKVRAMIGWLKKVRPMTADDVGDHRVAETISELRQARAAGKELRDAIECDRRERAHRALEKTSGLAGAIDEINHNGWGKKRGRTH